MAPQRRYSLFSLDIGYQDLRIHFPGTFTCYRGHESKAIIQMIITILYVLWHYTEWTEVDPGPSLKQGVFWDSSVGLVRLSGEQHFDQNPNVGRFLRPQSNSQPCLIFCRCILARTQSSRPSTRRRSWLSPAESISSHSKLSSSRLTRRSRSSAPRKETVSSLARETWSSMTCTPTTTVCWSARSK